MATAAVTLLKPRRRSVNPLAGGRASFPEIYYVKYIDNSRLVREVDRKKRRECFSLLGLGILFFLSVLLMSWQHLQCVRAGYEIEQLKVQRAQLEEWNNQLLLKEAALVDPQRIDTLARKDLGMVPSSPRQVIQVGEADALLPQPAESAEFARNSSVVGGDNPGEP
jgi:cell division protein FtsL